MNKKITCIIAVLFFISSILFTLPLATFASYTDTLSTTVSLSSPTLSQIMLTLGGPDVINTNKLSLYVSTNLSTLPTVTPSTITLAQYFGGDEANFFGLNTSCETKYYYDIALTSPDGRTIYADLSQQLGSQPQFTTGSCTNPLPSGTVSISTAGATGTASIAMTNLSDFDVNKYVLFVTNGNSITDGTPVGYPLPQISATPANVTVPISGLLAGTTYSYEVEYDLNESTPDPAHKILNTNGTFTTLPGGSVSVGSITGTSAVATIAITGLTSESPTDYILFITNDSNKASVPFTITLNDGSGTVNISPLANNTKYDYDVEVDKGQSSPTPADVLIGTNGFFSSGSSTTTSPSTTTTIPASPAGGIFSGCTGPKGCTFNDLIGLIKSVIHFVLFSLALPIAAIMFAYAGITLLFAGGSEESIGKAKRIFFDVLVGLIIAAAAWLIIETILSVLGYNQSWTTWLGF